MTGARPAGAAVSALRLFLVGGVVSYRALFNWITPWILVPTFMVEPVFQILLFAYLGRSAGVGSDEFFVIGNALVAASIPCLFAMDSVITGERRTQTLGLLLATPAARVPLFLGRALPVVLNGFLVAVFGLVAGGALLGIDVPPSAAGTLALALATCAFSCTGVGLLGGALGLRVRETAVLSNVLFGALLLLSGANVPLDRLPGWMAATAEVLPLTHGIAAARRLADGAPLADVAGLLGAEAVVGVVYVLLGLALLRWMEHDSRRRATLEIS